MIAAINDKQKVVWGIGRNDAEAIMDAHNESSKKPDINIGKLRCVPLKPGTPLEYDGASLFEYCIFNAETKKESTQFDLFGVDVNK